MLFEMTLEKGENSITISFNPVEIEKGILLSIIGLGLFIILLWKANMIFENRFIGYVGKYVYILCLLGFLLYIYILPFVQNIIAIVKYKI